MPLFLRGEKRKQAYWVQNVEWAHVMTMGKDLLCVPQRQSDWQQVSQLLLWEAKRMHGRQIPCQSDLSAIYMGKSLWNVLPFQTGEELLASFATSLWGLVGACLSPTPGGRAWKESDPATHTGAQIIGVGELGFLILDSSGRCSIYCHFWKFGFSFWMVTEWEHREPKEKGAKLLRWALISSCPDDVNILWIFFFIKHQMTLGSENNLAFG